MLAIIHFHFEVSAQRKQQLIGVDEGMTTTGSLYLMNIKNTLDVERHILILFNRGQNASAIFGGRDINYFDFFNIHRLVSKTIIKQRYNLSENIIGNRQIYFEKISTDKKASRYKGALQGIHNVVQI